jgi:hypothetical protein
MGSMLAERWGFALVGVMEEALVRWSFALEAIVNHLRIALPKRQKILAYS